MLYHSGVICIAEYHQRAMSPSYKTRLLNLLYLAVFCGLMSSMAAVAPAAFGHSTVQAVPEAVRGLSYGFYHKTCPSAERIVSKAVKDFLAPNISQAGALIRLTFHDCFVQGCDASVLLNSTAGEEFAPPNLSLRPEALAFIQQVKELLEAECPNTVSCADILSLAGREATFRAGGAYFKIPTGRLDSLNFADRATVLKSLPPPTSNISSLINVLTALGLDKIDLVALSGAHTVGIAHCSSFNKSILPTVESVLNPDFAQSLLKVCPNSNSNEAVDQDSITPNAFDNQYFKNMLNKEVLFDSDRALLDDETTKAVVEAFAANNKKFLKQFAYSFVKMSMVAVKNKENGGQGTIRQVCYSTTTTSPASATPHLPGVNMMYTSEDSLFGQTSS